MKKKLLIASGILLVLCVSGVIVFYFRFTGRQGNPDLAFSTKDFIKTEATANGEGTDSVTAMLNPRISVILDSISTYAEQTRRKMNGEKITIAIIGVDSRLGPDSKHADANHVLTFWLDSGYVDIVSVPRCVEVDCGFPDTTTFNILAVYRAQFGRTQFLPKLAEFAGVSKIDYYIEFGFSQAIRLMEILGFKDKSAQMLRVLRSRKSFREDDFQRSYNQGQFIRQMILSQFHKADGIAGDLLLRAALMMVETNLSVEKAKYIVSRMDEAGFPKSSSDISVVTRPRYGKLRTFDFVNDSARNQLIEYVNAHSRLKDTAGRTLNLNSTNEISKMVGKKIADALESADRVKKNPRQVINALQIYYEQRAWNQVSRQDGRTQLRDRVCSLLSEAFDKLGKKETSRQILEFLALDKKVDEVSQ